MPPPTMLSVCCTGDQIQDYVLARHASYQLSYVPPISWHLFLTFEGLILTVLLPVSGCGYYWNN